MSKLDLQQKLKDISSDYVVKSEELITAKQKIYGEDIYDMLIEVKGSTDINMEDIIKIRKQQKKPFTESELLYMS